MTRNKFIRLLRRGKKRFWCEDFTGIDLSGVYVGRVTFINCTFDHAGHSGAVFDGTRFQGSYMMGTWASTFNGCEFFWMDLAGDFRNADLAGCDIVGCDTNGGQFPDGMPVPLYPMTW